MEQLTGEVLNINNEYGSYQEYKAAVDTELQKSAESFVRIGYLLKVARDTDILMESGYGSVNDFAAAEYSLDKSQVSRFIRINDEYSEGGYSDRLQEQYRDFGYAKLALMLTLPAAVTGELTADYTKTEISMIKDEIDEEKQRTDIEVLLEQQDARQQEYTLFGRVLCQIGRDRPELYLQMHEAVMDGSGQSGAIEGRLADVLAPAGERMISVRIPGERKLLLSIKGPGTDPAVVNAWTNEREICTWDAFIRDMRSLCKAPEARESWEILYGETFPAKEPTAAPVQPEKQAPKKPQRVLVTSPQKPQTPETTGSGGAEETTARKEGESDHDENRTVAPVQPRDDAQTMRNAPETIQNDTETAQNAPAEDRGGMGNPADEPDAGSRIPEETDSTDTVPPDIGGNDPEPADNAAGTVSGNTEAVMGNAADTVEEPPLTEDVTGQISIADMPECLPDNTAAEQKETAVSGYLTALRDNLDKIYILTERGEYRKAEEWLEAVRGTIRKISEVSDG